jgi:hypothetical protein
MTTLGEQRPDVLFDGGVVSFAGVAISDVSGRVDEILRRPIVIIERAPDGVSVVECDRIRHT